jgi:hypothetical protein
MNDFTIYIFKSAIWIAVFYGIYRFFLLNETFLRFNRVFLLAGTIAPFFLALCQFRYPVEIMNPVSDETGSALVSTNEAIPVSFDIMKFFLLVYAAGMFALFLYYGFGLNKIRKMIHKRRSSFGEKPRVIYISGIQSSFSFFGYVFMDPQTELQDIENELILAHETAHVEQRHWVDILLAQLVCVFQWFNPFAWLYLSAVKQNHEFLADRAVIDKGYSPAVYQAVLINSTFKIPVFAFTNSFAYYNKFKRIAIMKKNVSKPAKKLVVLLLLPVLAVFLAAFAQPEYHYSTPSSLPEIKGLVSQDTVKKTEHSGTPIKALTAPKNPAKIQPLEVTGQVLDTDGKPIIGAAVIQRNGKQGTITDVNGKFTIVTDPDSEMKIVYFDKEEAIIKLSSITKGKPVSITLKDEVGKPAEVFSQKSENMSIILGDNLNGTVSPLIIVDDKEFISSLNNINPKDIESVSVLKDEYAVSRYGEKGKNGVLIIKMKKNYSN